MQTRNQRFSELDQIIARGEGSSVFTPCITVEDDPTGPGRKLWCWHLPGGAREFHGIFKMIPPAASTKDYVAALATRFRLTVDPGSVKCIAPEVSGTPPPPLSPPASPPKPPVLVAKPAEEHILKDLQIAELVPHLTALGDGKRIKIEVPRGLGVMSFRNNLRTRLYTKEKLSEWSLTSIFPQDAEYVAGQDRVFLVKRRSKPPEMTATKRVEERIETRVTESTVRMPIPAPIAEPLPEPPPLDVKPVIKEQPVPPPTSGNWEARLLDKFPSLDPAWPDELQTSWFHALDRLQGIGHNGKREPPAIKSPSSYVIVPPTPRPASYLPTDGEDAKRAADLLYIIASVDPDGGDWEKHQNAMDELWSGVDDRIKFHRDAKSIVDSVLGPWLDVHFELNIFDEELWADTWRELWERVHVALCDQFRDAAKTQDEAITKERKRMKDDSAILREERAFLELALKFFAEEDKLTEGEWKRINDKALPEMARKLVESKNT